MTATAGEILEIAANDGSIDAAEWPRTLQVVLERLDVIVHSAFPLPPHPHAFVSSQPSQAPPAAELGASQIEPPSSIGQQPDSSARSSAANGEQAEHRDDPSKLNGSNNSLSLQPAGPDSTSQLPPDTQALYESCLHTLTTTFSTNPPYTLQRLAELILHPQKHYRFLPSYLAALDQLLSVSSSTVDFPMPALHVNANSSFLTNGDAPAPTDQGLSGDESLGGALLTPIPWLKRDSGPVTISIDSNPDPAPAPTPQESADDHLSTDASLRAEGAVTQGELLRQEQQAGVVPVAQTRRPTSHLEQAPDESVAVSVEEQQQQPHAHARGPEEIGMEDMGPQDDGGVGRPLDIEGAVGRGRSVSPQAAGEKIVGGGNADHVGRTDGEEQKQEADTKAGGDAAGESTAVNGGVQPQAGSQDKADEDMPDAS